MTDQNDAAAAPQTNGQFLLQRIYLKNLSFEAPGAPGVFATDWRADTQVQFNSGASKISETQYEVSLRVTVTTSNDGKVAFIAEADMAGIFLVEGATGPQLERTLGSTCPNILFPYVREVLTNTVARGTFPQLLLQPMNFDAIFNDAKRRKQAQAAEAQAAAAQQPSH